MAFFQDIVDLARAGWKPSEVKAVLEMLETSPAVKGAEVKKEEDGTVKVEPKEEPAPSEDKVDKKDETPKEQDDIAVLQKLLTQED